MAEVFLAGEYIQICVHIVYSVQVLNPTMTKCVGGEGARGGESH